MIPRFVDYIEFNGLQVEVLNRTIVMGDDVCLVENVLLTSVENVGTGETELYSVTNHPSAEHENGRTVVVEAVGVGSGIVAGTIRFRMNGAVVVTVPLTTGAASGWWLSFRVVRTDENSARVFVTGWNGTSSVFHYSGGVSADWKNPITLAVTGQAGMMGGTGDVRVDMAWVKCMGCSRAGRVSNAGGLDVEVQQ